jgi:hypothetical protein
VQGRVHIQTNRCQVDKKRFAVVYRKYEAVHGRTNVSDLEIDRAFERYRKKAA